MLPRFRPETEFDHEVERVLDSLTLKEKVALLSGKDFWGTAAFPEKGVHSVVVTDGPHGVRIGNENSAREKNQTATAFPTGVAMASTWDVNLINQAAIALAEETRANQCDVLLGPCINMVRTPLAGRNFETFAEDPFLAGKLGAAYVNGLQSKGIGASLKHYAVNNQEEERTRGSSQIDERTLREIYLSAFEIVVKEANPWTVMCSYNRINGEHASQNEHLLRNILKDEWGYDGVVVSDWNANHTVFESVRAGLDLEMPGPANYFGKYLEEAIKTWQLDESYLNDACRRVLRLGKRVTDFKSHHPEEKGEFSNQNHIELARRLAAESMVLLKNDNQLLPLAEETFDAAVIGPCAKMAIYGGGGSSIVNCAYTVSPMQGLVAALGRTTELPYVLGCSDKTDNDKLDLAGIKMFVDGKQGIQESWFNNRHFNGEPVHSDVVDAIDFWTLFPPTGIDGANFSLRWQAEMQVEQDGLYEFQTDYQGLFSLSIDGVELISEEHWQDKAPFPFYTVQKAQVHLEKGRRYKFVLSFRNTLEHDRQAMILKAQYIVDEQQQLAQIAEAVELAKSHSHCLLFVGHAVGFEAEGTDRKSLQLPGAQNRLIEAVCDANPNAIVILNTGAPVEMPWLDKAGAVIQAHFFGQEGGHALADIILGHVNPSGHLTTSYPKRLQDTPAYLYHPGNRLHVYGEGIFMGYRYYDYREMDVLFPFGHGLSYSNFDLCNMRLTGALASGDLVVHCTLTNTSEREGSAVVQLYIGDKESSEARPLRELKGFAKQALSAGESVELSFPLNERSFCFYSPLSNKWLLEPGEFIIELGFSSRDLRLNHSLVL